MDTPGHLGSGGSWFWVILLTASVGIVVLAGLVEAVIGMLRAWSADRSFDPQTPLRHGTKVVAGEVALEDGQPSPVRVEIVQEGTDRHGKHGWSHTWTEVSRRVHAVPFAITTASGARVRIEPGASPIVIDELDDFVPRSRTSRVMRAVLDRGEHVFVVGQLQAGTDGQGPVLMPPARGRMLFSTKPLGDRFRSKAKFYAGWAIGGLVFLAIVHATAFSFFDVRAFWADNVQLRITEKKAVPTYYKGKRSGDDHFLYAQRVGGRSDVRHKLDVVESKFREVQVGDLLPARAIDHVPLFVVFERDPGEFALLGNEPSIDGGDLALGIVGVILFILTYLIAAYWRRPWYERSTVVQRGPGRLDG